MRDYLACTPRLTIKKSLDIIFENKDVHLMLPCGYSKARNFSNYEKVLSPTPTPPPKYMYCTDEKLLLLEL